MNLQLDRKVTKDFQRFEELPLAQGRPEPVVVHDDEDARQEGEVDAHVEDGEQVLVELHPAEDEEQEEDGQAVQDRLDDPGPKGRVDVDQVSTLSVLYHILERFMRISQIWLEKH